MRDGEALRVSQRSIEQVREAANIVEVASEFTALRRQGTRYSGLCPYPDHAEKTPSFSVTPDRGFYYCFGCLEANERIWTSRGLIPIIESEIGDEVIGLGGQREKIVDKEVKTGSTLLIRTGAAKEGLELTPDHWCVFVKRDEAVRTVSGLHRRGRDDEKLRLSSRLRGNVAPVELSVSRASDVRPGDFLLYPVIPDGDRDDSPLSGEATIKAYTKGPRNRRITNLHVNESTAWLYGLWLAEGSLYRGGVKWSFGAHESETLAPQVARLLEQEFGRSSTMSTRTEKNNCEVTCSSTDLCALFSRWFGRGCANKRIPLEALYWTTACQEALIEGYLAGDGCLRNGETRAEAVSEELAYGIFALCVQSRKVCSLNSTPVRVGDDGVKHQKAYSIHLLRKESLKGFFAPVAGANYYWSAVRDIEVCKEEPTTVVDIATTGSHTFLTRMGITHNCQRGGDTIKLVSELKSLPFAEAITYLAERSNIELEYEGSSPAELKAAGERSARRRSIHKALAATAVYYHKYLLNSQAAEPARRYLQSRQIEPSTIEEFRLGYAPARGSSGLLGALERLGLDRVSLDAAGLLSSRGGERFSGRITFPISDQRGRIVGFGARAMGDAQPKYLNSPETEVFNKRDLLYGFPQVAETMRKERSALVVEGYTDVLMLYQSGIKNAVATLGTATTPAHLRTLSRFAEKIYILFDPDAAGEKAIERAAATAAELKMDLRVVRLPEDPADWLLHHPPEEFAGLLSGAVPILEYSIRRIVRRARGADAMERSRAVPEVKALIHEVKDPVLHREALRLASEALGVGQEVLQEPEPDFAEEARPGRRRTPGDPLWQAGREVLALIIARPDLTSKLLEEGLSFPKLHEPVKLRAEDFGDEDQRGLFASLLESGGNTDNILADERARPFMDQIGALAAEGEKLYPSEIAAREAWLRLKILSRKRDKNETPDYDEKDRIHSEMQSLVAALRTISIEA